MFKKVLLITLTLLLTYSVQSQSWTATATSPNGARTGNTATLLNNGNVIIIGGQYSGFSGVNDTVELYDVVLDTIIQLASIPAPATMHSSVCISDSTVIVAGGFISSGVSTDSVFQYNINTDTWSVKANLPYSIAAHTATLLNDNRILYAAGQHSGSLDNPYAFIYDPITNTYSNNINLLSERAGHTATLLDDGKVLLAGGYSWATSSTVLHCELFDPETETWISAGNIPAGRTGGERAIRTYNGNVLVIGGYNFYGSAYVSNIDKYDAQTNSWATIGNISPLRSNFNIALLEDSTVLVCSGFQNSTYHSDAVIIDPQTGNQTSTTSLPSARSDAQTIRLRDNRILLMNGKIGTGSYHDNGLIYGTASATPQYSVSFHVTESDSVTPINNADITFNSQTLQTDVNGDVSFANVEISNGIPFEITHSSYSNYNGSASLQLNNIEIHINMAEILGTSNNITITGKFVFSVIASEAKQSVNLSNNPKGIYFVKITTSKAVITKKLIIK